MKCEIQTAPFSAMRNSQAGDWFFTPEGIKALAAEMENEDHSFLIGIHELLEAYLCRKRGITDEDVTDWDARFESLRKDGDESEAGDHPSAPYYREHVFASNIERLIAAELKIHWPAYEQAIGALFPNSNGPTNDISSQWA